MKKLSRNTCEFLLNLVRRELDVEEDYQSGNCDYEGNRDEDSLDYVKDLIRAQKELLLQKNNGGIFAVIDLLDVDNNLDRFNLTSSDIA